MMHIRIYLSQPICLLCAVLLCVLFAAGIVQAADSQQLALKTEDTILRLKGEDGGLVLTSMTNAHTNREWIVPSRLPFVKSAKMDGRQIRLHWQLRDILNRDGGREWIFHCKDPNLLLTSRWVAQPGPGPVEHFLIITNLGTKEVLLPQQMSLAFQMCPPNSSVLEHWWVEKGAGTPSEKGVHQENISPHYAAKLISGPYALSEPPREAIPWTSVFDPKAIEGWYAGIEFSGRVRIELQGYRIEFGIDADKNYQTRLKPGQRWEAPPVFVGCFSGTVDDGSNRLRRWVEAYLRPPVHDPLYPLLTNNSWGSGMAVDAALAAKMIDESAALGLEMFHLDAGWYRGVGCWQPHPVSFPDGLTPVANRAHALGLRFGLWTAWTQGGDGHGKNPNGGEFLSVFDGRRKGWFAKDLPQDWRERAFSGYTVCLGEPAAVKWCIAELDRMVREYKVDLLEHDQRMVVKSCSRTDHRHTSSRADVSYHAACGYYQVLDAIRALHPQLLFEDCVNGGRMVDYGAVRRAHYICVTDTYDPLSNRRSFYDASYALPAAMCENYIAHHPGKTLANFVYMLRSGMMGWCTIMCPTMQWTAEQKAAAQRQFKIYKTHLRPLIRSGNLYHVSRRPDGIRWDGIQYYDPGTGKGVLYAFRGTTEDLNYTFRLQGLNSKARYRVSFEDGSSKSYVSEGKKLMNSGVTVSLAEPVSSELVYLERMP